MQVQEIMTADPACCPPRTTLQDAARLMSDCDCGEIPVVDERCRPIGVVTDRDIACRAVAQGLDPKRTPVSEVMSSPVVTARRDTSLEECCARMEENQIRRIPVVDENGICCGMVSQADIARSAPVHEIAEVIREVSRPNGQRAGSSLA